MMLESELEGKMKSELASLFVDSERKVQFVGSRDIEEDGVKDKDDVDSVIAIHTGFRTNDAFSLSPITVNLAVTITTRIENDVSGVKHEEVTAKIAQRLSYWHFKSNKFTEAFHDLVGMFCGELRMNGGTGRSVDQGNRCWIDTISFSIRGSEKHEPEVELGPDDLTTNEL